MTLRARLVLSLALVTLVALVGGALTVLMTDRRDDASARARAAIDAEERIGRLRTSYLDQETGYRGYVLTAEPTFLEPYVRGRDEVMRLQQGLRGDLGARSDVHDALDRVRRAAARWYQLVEPDMRLADENKLGAVRKRLTGGQSKAAFDSVRGALDALAGAARREVLATRAASGDARSALSTVGVVTLAVLLTAFAVLAFLVRAWVTVPIRALSRAVKGIRGGAIDEPVALASPPELATLARDVDAMRRRLVNLVTESDRAREAMEQDAAVVLALGSQAEPELPSLPAGWSLAGEVRPAEGLIAGDTYDFVELRDHRLGLVVVDISGHGAVAGIVALRCKELLRSALALGTAPGEAIGNAAGQLRDLGDEVFLSAFVAVVDPSNDALTYANAGHPPALHTRADRSEPLTPTGPILGPFPARWATTSITIQRGEALAIFTDGLVDARDGHRVPFGEARLHRLVQPRPGDDAASIAARCLDAVEAYSPARRLPDDATIVVLHHSAG
jgi:sigma-B regulation protein RsbU (phosphoserine phosphatase)